MVNRCLVWFLFAQGHICGDIIVFAETYKMSLKLSVAIQAGKLIDNYRYAYKHIERRLKTNFRLFNYRKVWLAFWWEMVFWLTKRINMSCKPVRTMHFFAFKLCERTSAWQSDAQRNCDYSRTSGWFGLNFWLIILIVWFAGRLLIRLSEISNHAWDEKSQDHAMCLISSTKPNWFIQLHKSTRLDTILFRMLPFHTKPAPSATTTRSGREVFFWMIR